MVLEQTLCSSRDLTPGECNASSFEVTIANAPDLTGKTLSVVEEVDGYATPIPRFSGKVASSVLQSDHTSRKITAYDALHYLKDMDVTEWYRSQFPAAQKAEYAGDWSATVRYISPQVVKYNDKYYRYNCATTDIIDNNGTAQNVADELTGKNPETILASADLAVYVQLVEDYDRFTYSPITLKALRDALLEDVGLTTAAVTLPNDSVLIEYTKQTRLTFGTLMQAICQVNCRFGHINASGDFEYIQIAGVTEDYTGNIRSETTYEEYTVTAPDGIVAMAADGTELYRNGGSTNPWLMSNLLLSASNAQAITTNIITTLSGFAYTPASVSAIFSIPVDLGAVITFTTPQGDTITTRNLSQRFSGAQLIRQTITANGNQTRDNAQTVYESITYLQARAQAIQESVKTNVDAVEIARNNAEALATLTAKAQATANGKNTVFYADTTPPTTGRTTGDIWFDTDDGNKMYSWSGSAWTAEQFGNSAIADLAITNAKIADGTIQNAKIANLDAGKITTGQLSAARIDVAGIFAQNVTATGTITGATLKGTYIETVSGSVGGWTIGTNSLTRTDTATWTSQTLTTELGNAFVYYIEEDTATGMSHVVNRYMPAIEFGRGSSVTSHFGSDWIYFSTSSSSDTILQDGKLSVRALGSAYTYVTPAMVDLYKSSAAVAQIRIRNTVRNIGLHVNAAGQAGLYDNTNSSWIYRSDANQNVIIPHLLTVNSLSTTGSITSGSTASGGSGAVYAISPTRRITLHANSAGNAGLYDATNSKWIIYTASNQNVYIQHPLSVTGNLNVSGDIGVNGDYILIGGSSSTKSPYIQCANNKNNVALITTQSSAGVYHYATSGSSTAKWLIYIDQSGTVVANTSDIRYKDVYGNLPESEALTVLRGVNPINFSYKEDYRHIVQNGFSAQQMRDVLKKVGYRSYLNIQYLNIEEPMTIYDLNTPESDVIYSIDYSKLTPVLWKGWQIHDNEIEALKDEIAQLKARLEGVA